MNPEHPSPLTPSQEGQLSMLVDAIDGGHLNLCCNPGQLPVLGIMAEGRFVPIATLLPAPSPFNNPSEN